MYWGLLSLAGAYGLRMLGLYLVLPILSPYTASLPGGATFWVGMAVGSYGFAQTAFQVPFGAISDRFGRRRTIVAGLALFVLGSLVAALATSAPMLVLGRVLQGSGAISSAVMALVGDLAPPEFRQRAMSLLGITIGLTFGVGLIFGPLLAVHLSVPGLFYLCALMGVLSAAAVLIFVPSGRDGPHPPRATFRQNVSVLHDRSLLRVNLAVMALHLGLTALFVVLPLQIETLIAREAMGRVLAPAIGIGLLVLAATAFLVDRFRAERTALLVGAGLFVLGAVLLRTGFDRVGGLTLGLTVAVAGIAVLEPILPSLVTLYAGAEVRGLASGTYSMCQFFGAGVGGLAGAYYLARQPVDIVYLLGTLGLVIAAAASGLPPPHGPKGGARRTS
ncbi:MAG: MFS transporter [Candidatus Eisenbacteria bacterium]|nr:MFS transporter [Candidatus Eisenbacteria bacterium]